MRTFASAVDRRRLADVHAIGRRAARSNTHLAFAPDRLEVGAVMPVGDEIEWWPSLTAVPGVRWSSPQDVQLPAGLADARPRRREDPYGLGSDVEWIAGGSVLTDPHRGASPCSHLSWQVYDAPDAAAVERLTLTALLAPGTRSDYLEAVRFGTTHLQRRSAGSRATLTVQEAGMALIEADPEAARNAERRTGAHPEMVLRAPFTLAARTLLSAGLPVEAAAVEEREEQALGPNLGPGPQRPAGGVLAGLHEVWEAVRG